MLKTPMIRWSLLFLLIFALVLVPFLIFGEQVEAWTHTFINQTHEHLVWVVLVLGGMLSLDVLLPVPSSVVSTACGYLLGFFGGTLTSLGGMTLSCIGGFWLGHRFGRPMANRLVGAEELTRLERLNQELGDWAIVVSRPVPVLAESAVLFAGIGKWSFPRFMLLSTLSNAGISLVYGAVGAFSATVNSFLLAFFAALALPGLAMIVMRKRGTRQ